MKKKAVPVLWTQVLTVLVLYSYCVLDVMLVQYYLK